MSSRLTGVQSCGSGVPEPIGVRLAGWSLCLVAFLLPLKFGTLAVMPDASGFLDVPPLDWLIVSWPAHFSGIGAGVLLILALAGCGFPRRKGWGRLTALLWCAGLPVAVLWGCRGVPDFVFGALAHFYGLGAIAAGAALVFARSPRWSRNVLTALAAGTLLTCLGGAYQYFIGMAETRAYVAQRLAEGVKIDPIILARVADDRVFGSMVSCNALAGFLLLGAPLAIFGAVRAGEFFEPKRLSRIVFGSGAALLTVGILALTRSRGALVCAAIAGMGWLWDRNLSRRVRIGSLGILIVLLGAGAFWVSRSERGFLSTGERADYLRTTLKMTIAHPFGAGWGEFYHTHQKIKRSASDELARDPHNFVASFAAQCGIPGGLLAAAALFLPLAGLWRLRGRGARYKVAFWSCTAATLHLFMDAGIHVPAVLGTLLLVELALLGPHDREESIPVPKVRKVLAFAVLVFYGIMTIGVNGWWLAGEHALGRLSALVQPQNGAMIQYSRNHPEAVLSAYHDAAFFRPWSAYPPWLAGDYFLAQDDAAAAKEFYRNALTKNDRQAALWWRLSLVAAKEGDPEGARKYLEKAHDLFPAHPHYRLP